MLTKGCMEVCGGFQRCTEVSRGVYGGVQRFTEGCTEVSLQVIRLHGGVSLQLIRLHGGVSLQIIRLHRGVHGGLQCGVQRFLEVCGGCTEVYGGSWRGEWRGAQRYTEGCTEVHGGMCGGSQGCIQVHGGVHRGSQRCTEG